MSNRIYLSSPHMGGEEIHFINEAFEANWIAPVGPHISAFEEDLGRYSRAGHAVALSSGTAAIHLALILLGVEQGDEVLCSSFTFAGSSFPILYQRAVPVFIDSEKDTWNMDPELLEAAIKDRIKKGRKPKALILVHLYGMPAKLAELLKVAESYDIPVIEDAAEALGSSYHNKRLGAFGKFGIYSFNGNKIITTGGGGALLSHDNTLIEKARFLSTQARDVAVHYQHSEVGFNYRLSNIAAGIGRGQMKVLDERVNQRRSNFLFYQRELAEFEGINFVSEMENCFSNRWLTTITIDPQKIKHVDRETMRVGLEKHNIESRPLWKPMHMQPLFKDYPFYGNGISSQLFQDGLCLPSGSNLTDNQREKIIEVLKKLLSSDTN